MTVWEDGSKAHYAQKLTNQHLHLKFRSPAVVKQYTYGKGQQISNIEKSGMFTQSRYTEAV